MLLTLDLYQTVAMAVIVFAMGSFLRKKVGVGSRGDRRMPRPIGRPPKNLLERR